MTKLWAGVWGCPAVSTAVPAALYRVIVASWSGCTEIPGGGKGPQGVNRVRDQRPDDVVLVVVV